MQFSVRDLVVDTGIDTTHPALKNRIWKNPQEIAANGVDDDGNGYVDDTQGWNFANGAFRVWIP